MYRANFGEKTVLADVALDVDSAGRMHDFNGVTLIDRQSTCKLVLPSIDSLQND